MYRDLNERSRKILEAIIEDFIATGEPVGSRTVTRRHHLGISPATVRNVMADLEEAGFLYSPHTSAGRVPTEKGYRFYVDTMIEVRDLSFNLRKAIEDSFSMGGLGLEDRLKRAGQVLSATSSYAGLVSYPSFEATVFRHIEFVKLSSKKILAVLVSQSGNVQNKVVEVQKPISKGELEKITNFLNSKLTGLPLCEVKGLIVKEMKEEKALYDSLLQQAFELSREVFESQTEGTVFVEGASNILDLPEFADLECMKRLFRTFEQKNLLVDLLEKCRSAEGTHVFIGSEFDSCGLEGCSLVTSSYVSKSGISGTLGILGPSRMTYSVVIPIVAHTARQISRFLDAD
ncbi:MAG: heat-inducible transcription repressor HrcA [Deltaproteobacteria bacterium]|nr:heat-inducible transcription repressor HrcA [Deltaproteobacteria bacterium]